MIYFTLFVAIQLLILAESFRPYAQTRHLHVTKPSIDIVKAYSVHRSSLRRTFALRMAGADENPFYKGLDAYQILEIPRTSTKKDIKTAYRKLVATWHPDKFPDDPVKQKEGGLRMEKINRAYYCLEDEDRRRRYDTYGERGVGTSAASEEQMSKMGGPDMGGGFGNMGGVVDINVSSSSACRR